MPALDGITGIVFGGIFGSIFIVTCIISAIKAVRDRRVIKRRIATKEREKLQNGVKCDKPDSNIEEVLPTSSRDHRQKLNTDTTCESSLTHKNGSFERLDLSVYSIDKGLDNVNFKHSFTDIKHHMDVPTYTSTAVNVPSYQNKYSNKTQYIDNKYIDKSLSHLPPECLAVKKVMRSNSYELAISEHSWIPMDADNYSTPHTTKTYKHCDARKNYPKFTNACFENKAFRKEDPRREMMKQKL
ncbi:hypothetical protein ACF0H5_002145 [Mactra antiquata]